MAMEILRAPAKVEHSQVSGVEEEYLAVALSPTTTGSLWCWNSLTHSHCVIPEEGMLETAAG